MKPDLDSTDNITLFINLFYEQVLLDDVLKPIFVDVAKINLDQHLGHIRAYWEKLLLGKRDYQRNTMEIHRALNGKSRLTPPEQFSKWLELFVLTAETHFEGEKTTRAIQIATNIAGNMEDRFYHGLSQPKRRML